jgi:WD40 repeat protein
MHPTSVANGVPDPREDAGFDDVIDRFEDAWQAGTPPALDDFLPAGDSGRRPLLVRLVHIDLERRLKAGEAARVEDYLARYPELTGGDGVVLGLLAAEYEQRRRREPALLPEEYARRFPQYLDDLPRCLKGAGGDSGRTLPYEATPPPDAGESGPQIRPPGSVTWPHEGEAPAGVEVPGYEILGLLGKGGMGVVYKARQVALDRVVALKMIRAGPHAGPGELARFRTEAEAAARLQHPHVVQVFEVGQSGGQPYFSLEYVEGGSLAQKLAGSPWPARRAAELVLTLARAVHAAHERGIIHRDLKPANVLLTADGTPKVTDFGLAKRLNASVDQTHSGAVLGTPSHMAPEQARGQAREVGPRTDVYALGAILYECLTGRPPFVGETPLDTMLQVIHAEPVPPARLQPKVPRDLETVCLKCLEKDPARRYPNAEALADDLGRHLAGEPVRARPVRAWQRGVKWARRRPAVAGLLALSAVLLVLGVAGMSWQWQRAEERAEAEAKANKGAQAARDAEQVMRERVEDVWRQDRRHLYDAHVNLALQGWRTGRPGDVARVRELLDAHRPEAGEEDLRGFEWFHLWRLCHSDSLTLSRHKRWVRSLAYSPDGKLLATGSYDTTVRIWEAASGREVRVLRGHAKPVHRVAFRPGGAQLLSAGDDERVWLWDLRTGEGQPLYGHGARVWAAGFSPDGTLLASADVHGSVVLYDLAAHAARPGHPTLIDPVNCLTFSPDGKYLAFGCDDGWVHLWEDGGKRTRRDQVCGGAAAVLSLAFAPDGRTLACGCNDNVIRLWDAAAGKPLGSLRGHTGRIWGVAFDPAGALLASAGWDGVIKLWDVAGRREVETLRGHYDPVKSVAFSPADGRELASASVDGTVKLWRLPVGQEPAPLQAAGMIALAAASADGGTLLTVTTPESGQQPQRWVGGREFPLAPQLRAALAAASALALSPDGKLAAVGNTAGALSLWDLGAGKQVAAREGCHKDRIEAVGFSADGKTLATAGAAGGAVRLWDLGEDGISGRSPPLPSVPDVVLVQFSPDGRHLAAVSSRWTAEQTHHGRMVSPPTGKVLDTLPRDDVVRVWDLASGEERVERTVRGRARGLAFSPDGKVLAVAGSEKDGDHEYGVVRLWDPATGRDVRAPFTGHAGRVESAAFAPDGKTLAAGDRDGQVKLWDPATGQEKVAFFPAAGPVLRVAFAGDRTALVAVSERGAIHSWRAATAEDVVRYAERASAAEAEHGLGSPDPH